MALGKDEVEIRHLQAFVAVAEEGSFSRAAARLHTAQPPLSRQIRQLERQLDAELFVRTPRGADLTRHGRVLLDHARLALAANRRAVAAVRRSARGDAGTLRLGFIHGAGGEVMADAIRSFEATSAAVRVEPVGATTWADPSAGTREGSVDVAFVRGPFDARELRLTVLALEERVVLLPGRHPLADRELVTLDELFAEPWADPQTPDPVARAHWLCLPERGGRAPLLGPRVHHSEEAMECIRSGRCIGLCPRSIAERYLHDSLVFRPVAGLAPSEVCVAVREGEDGPLVSRFVTAAVTAAGPRRDDAYRGGTATV